MITSGLLLFFNRKLLVIRSHMRKKKIYLVSLLILLMVISVTVYCCNKIITDTARGKLYTAIENIPFNKVGLLLGTSKFV